MRPSSAVRSHRTITEAASSVWRRQLSATEPGSTQAAPVFREVAEKTLQYLKVPTL